MKGMNDTTHNTNPNTSEDTMNTTITLKDQLNTNNSLQIGPYILWTQKSGNVTCTYTGNHNRVLWVTDDPDFAIEKAMRYFN